MHAYDLLLRHDLSFSISMYAYVYVHTYICSLLSSEASHIPTTQLLTNKKTVMIITRPHAHLHPFSPPFLSLLLCLAEKDWFDENKREEEKREKRFDRTYSNAIWSILLNNSVSCVYDTIFQLQYYK
jgi:hypothetical protein